MKNVFERNKEKLIKYIKEKDNIIAIYLFGSFADGSYNEKSDIDLAVLYEKKYDFTLQVSDMIDIEKIFENTKVDYIDLEEVNLFFRFSILKNGKIIYVKNEEKLYDYIHRTQISYIDMKYSRDKYVNYVLNHSSINDEEDNNEKITEKLIYLNEILFELKELSKMNKFDFYKSNRDISAMENYLRKAIQIIIDLADDMVSKNRLRALFIIL